LASRRRRRKTIGKVVSDVERRVRVVEKRPGAKRLKRNVVTTEKIKYRTIAAKNITTDGVTPNEVSFGTTLVTDTEPTAYLKEGTTWFDPGTGETKVYDPGTEVFVDLAAVDSVARASADGKNTIYRQNSQPTGGTYVAGDTWFDSDDNNKIYRYNGTAWVALQLGGNALANIDANAINTGTLNANSITVSNLDVGTMTTGDLSASRISAGTISASISITAPTITGGTIKTAATGTRIELNSTNANRINFFGSATTQGLISVNDYRMFMYAPASTLAGGAVFSLYGDEAPSTPGGAFITAGPTLGLTFAMSSTTISMNQGTYGLRVSANGVAVDGAAPEANYMLRGTRISSNASAATSGGVSGVTDGFIILIREA
jgi:hypothetical protein